MIFSFWSYTGIFQYFYYKCVQCDKKILSILNNIYSTTLDFEVNVENY